MVGTNGCARIAVVDPQPLFSRGLAMLLPSVSEGRVEVAEAVSAAAEAAGMVRRCRPDLVLVDLGLPPPGGLRAIGAIRRTEPGVAVVAMGPEPADESVLAAVHAGARGVLHKSTEPEALVLPLLALMDGWAVVPATALARLSTMAGADSRSVRDGLCESDRRLWCLLASGRTIGQIADELHVSERTVKRLSAALFRRLRVSSRTEAAALAGRSGLLDVADR